ncbi:DUF6503 family protein [Poritiphilus flavus]|uniref:Uncharacterized protein n=1 Tax=Poritiphilus flavus TaxID=2697053 RepID=A0A6L9E868_9FLAO|nr:DUF6503 family protein [Poritiphilus flavus]NAS10803.1 hypothetical protein [Poritiphilus flavus]
MKKLFLGTLCILWGLYGMAQSLSGSELLARSIAYHDPQGQWENFKGQLSITMSTPKSSDRMSIVTIDLPSTYFSLKATKDDIGSEYILDKGNCTVKLNGSTTISEEEAAKHRLSCERAETMKNYYTYLYGLPMKLKDPGTILDPKVQEKTFKGKTYLVLKVTYEESVGSDIWYFYFDPNTYAMEVYQFYRKDPESPSGQKGGEYILLNGMEEVSGIKMPKVRSWYYNENEQFLGKDTLTKASGF